MSQTASNRAVFLLSLVGLFISGFLTYLHARNIDVPCTKGAGSGCDAVAHHWSAKGLGIPALEAVPTAAFGLLYYLFMTCTSFARTLAAAEAGLRLAALQRAASLAALATTGYLTYLEAYVIHAWCQWCLGSAAVVVLLNLVLLAQRLLGSSPGAAAPVSNAS
jgi:uncharacterized membrane protein